jgi:uroporphyrinogen-III synthase
MSKTLLVTRPLSQGQSLCEQLQARGFVVHHVPVMEIEALQDAASIARNESCFARLEKYHGIIVVSLNAAEQSLPWFARYPLSSKQAVFSVGKTTADFLQRSSIFDKSTVLYPEQQMDSEGLLALSGLTQESVKGRHFLLLRGEGGRELIAQTLTARGAIVDSCELYRRFIPVQNAPRLQACLPAIDGIVINSGESLENFLSLAGDINVAGKVLVVPGSRVAEAARRAGFQHIIVAANATDAAILDVMPVAFAT